MYISVVVCTNYPFLVANRNPAVIISQPLFFHYTNLPSDPRRRCSSAYPSKIGGMSSLDLGPP